MNTPIIDDILATHEQGFEFRGWVEMDKLATELLALRAEMERLASERASAIRVARDLCAGGEFPDTLHLADVIEKHVFRAGQSDGRITTPTPPRRLREVTLGALSYRCLDGIVQFKRLTDGAWVKSHNVDTEHVPALADLLANPEEPQPVETLESIIEPALTRSYVAGVGRSGGTWIGTEQLSKEVAEQIRAHLATQPQNTPSDAKNVGAALEYSTQPPAITPEQAVAVLVAHGAKERRGVVVYEPGRAYSRRRVESVLVLPTATPEGGK